MLLFASLAAAASFPDLSGRDVVTVLLLGDSGDPKGFRPVARSAAKVCFAEGRAPCDLALLLGDNVYEEGFRTPGASAWRRSFAIPMAPFLPAARGPAQFRAWVTPGNHDWDQHLDGDGPERISAAVATTDSDRNHAIGDLWQLPGLAYQVPGLPAWLHLHAIDTQTLVKSQDASLLDQTRDAFAQETGWKVVFGHHPPVSTGGHGASTKETDDERMAALLESLRPVGLDLVLAGHDHDQELLVTGGVPVVVEGNSSKGRAMAQGPYAGCSRWSHGGEDARGFAIATFRPDTVTIEFFDGDGNPYPPQTFSVTPAASTSPIGTCDAAAP